MRVYVIEGIDADEVASVLEDLKKYGAQPGEIAAVKRSIKVRDPDWRKKIGEGVRKAAARRSQPSVAIHNRGGARKGTWKKWAISEVRKLKRFYRNPENHFSNGRVVTSKLRAFSKELGRNIQAVRWKASTMNLGVLKRRTKVIGSIRMHKAGGFRPHKAEPSSTITSPDVDMRVRRAKFMHSRAKFYYATYKYPYPKALAAAAQDWNARGKKHAIPVPISAAIPFPVLKNVRCSQLQAQASFKNLFQQAEQGRVEVYFQGALSLFGIDDEQRWSKFLVEIVEKSSQIEKAVGTSKHLSIRGGSQSMLVIS